MSWSELISDLEKSGLTQTEIGNLAGCSQSMVSDLKTGKRGVRLGFEIGTSIKKLWQERCGYDRSERIYAEKDLGKLLKVVKVVER